MTEFCFVILNRFKNNEVLLSILQFCNRKQHTIDFKLSGLDILVSVFILPSPERAWDKESCSLILAVLGDLVSIETRGLTNSCRGKERQGSSSF